MLCISRRRPNPFHRRTWESRAVDHIDAIIRGERDSIAAGLRYAKREQATTCSRVNRWLARASRAFQGQHGCERLHKIVEFELPANRDLILQLRVGTAEEAGVAITAATPL